MTGGTNNNDSFGLRVNDYGPSLYYPSTTGTYSSCSPTDILQASYPVAPYGVSHPNHMGLYNSQLKHDFG